MSELIAREPIALIAAGNILALVTELAELDDIDAQVAEELPDRPSP